MCGIAGVFGRPDASTTRAMLGAIAHRGPDDEHVALGSDFTLGARRLSIVDLADGRQPMCNERETVWAAQNGEIYNFPKLRPQLLARGHTLKTRCDTECLPHLYEDHGSGFVRHIDGMFAVAIWDDAEKVGVLARDRMGKKPLYYHHRDGILYFSSEIKSLLHVPGFDRQLNLEALHHYLGYKHVPHPLCIFEGISILPPAHRLIFQPGSAPKVERYWELDYSPSTPADAGEDDLVDRLHELL